MWEKPGKVAQLHHRLARPLLVAQMPNMKDAKKSYLSISL